MNQTLLFSLLLATSALGRQQFLHMNSTVANPHKSKSLRAAISYQMMLDANNAMKGYFNADATSFWDCCANKDVFPTKKGLSDKMNQLENAMSQQQTIAFRMGQAGGRTFSMSKQDLAKVNSVSRKIKTGKGAVCTTFAIGAVGELFEFDDSKVYTTRVEIVALSNHVFVVVGRSGSKLKFNAVYPASSNWGSGAVIVDPWLATLGWPGVHKISDSAYPDNRNYGELSGTVKVIFCVENGADCLI